MKSSTFEGVKVRGIVSVLPSEERENSYFSNTFSSAEIQKLEALTGIQKRNIVSGSTSTSDLCHEAASKLMTKLGWSPNSVDGIIFISQTPDHILPATACILQNRLGLPTASFAFDVNLGCSGYTYGLWLAHSLISSRAAKRILLLVGDTISKIVAPKDRSTVFLFGDCGTATALETDALATKACFVLGSDGSGARDLMVPGKIPDTFSSQGSYERKIQSDGNERGPMDLYMDGGAVFNFTLNRVPEMVSTLLEESKSDLNSFDYFVFHQANSFMIRHLGKKLKINPEKIPLGIVDRGNTSSASIPLTITDKLSETLFSKKLKLGLFGFGVGFSWAGCTLEMGPLDVCKTEILGKNENPIETPALHT